MGSKTISAKLNLDDQIEAWLAEEVDGYNGSTSELIKRALAAYFGYPYDDDVSTQPQQQQAQPATNNGEVVVLLQAMLDEQRATREAIAGLRVVQSDTAQPAHDEREQAGTKLVNADKAQAFFGMTASQKNWNA